MIQRVFPSEFTNKSTDEKFKIRAFLRDLLIKLISIVTFNFYKVRDANILETLTS